MRHTVLTLDEVTDDGQFEWQAQEVTNDAKFLHTASMDIGEHLIATLHTDRENV